MTLVRIHVTPLGNGYIAESSAPEITAMGATAEEAIEHARLQAVQFLKIKGWAGAGMLLARLSEAHRESIAMQPLGKPFSLEDSAADYGVLFFDSDGNTMRPREIRKPQPTPKKAPISEGARTQPA